MRWMSSVRVAAAAVVLALFRVAGADSTSQFIYPDEESAQRGILGFLEVEHGNGEGTTWVFASDFVAVVDRTGETASGLTLTVGVGGAGSEISLRLLQNGLAEFIKDGEVVAQVSPDGLGGWAHWGTETLVHEHSYHALLLSVLDTNLQQARPQVLSGYWACVGRVLWCEALSAACVVTCVGQPAACSAVCGTPAVATPACIGCWVSWPGICGSVCLEALDCWQTASADGCVPW